MQLIAQSVVALPMDKLLGCCAQKADDAASEASKVATSTGAPKDAVSFPLSKFQVNTSKGEHGG